MGKVGVAPLLEPCVDIALLRRAWPDGLPDGPLTRLDVRDTTLWALALHDLADAVDGKSDTRWEVTFRPVNVDPDKLKGVVASIGGMKAKLDAALENPETSESDRTVYRNLVETFDALPGTLVERLETHSLYELKVRGLVVMTTSFAFPTKSLATALVLARIKAREEL
jgi:hypothetical protein